MVSGLNGLLSLDQVLHLTAGPVLRTGSSLFSFTHMLHSRYSKDDLGAYSAHPEHLRVVWESGLLICEDLMAVDWIAEGFSGSIAPPPGLAVKVGLLKLKENLGENVRDEVIGVIRGIKEEGSGAVAQLTCGVNFSPARAKGFSIGSLAVFKGVAEMEAADSNKELVESGKEKVRDFLDGVTVVDYLVPGSSTL